MWIRTGLAAVVLCLVLPALGCAARRPATVATPEVVSSQTRARAIATRLGAGSVSRPVCVLVTPSPRVGAYAWPGGQIVLTRGLVALLDEEELAAAIAHELGHLNDAGHARPPAALSGRHAGPDAEYRADVAGCGLLEAAGYSRVAMARMLSKVARTRGMTAACRARLEKRIGLLGRRPIQPQSGRSE